MGRWALYRLAGRDAWGAEAPLLFLPPDALVADGTIRAAAARLGEGWRAVVLPRPRVVKDEVETQVRVRLRAQQQRFGGRHVTGGALRGAFRRSCRR